MEITFQQEYGGRFFNERGQNNVNAMAFYDKETSIKRPWSTNIPNPNGEEIDNNQENVLWLTTATGEGNCFRNS